MKIYLLLLYLILLVSCATLPLNQKPDLTIDPADGSVEHQLSILSASGTKIELSGLDQFVDQQMGSLAMPGLSIAVISNGEVVYYRSKGVSNLDSGLAVDKDSIFEAASLSKPVFAYFVLRLVDKGVLDLDQPLYEYLRMNELEYDPRYHQVTARMVLSHTAGFPNWRWFDPAPAERNIERGKMYMKHNPGTFGYSGEGYNYLALVIAHLSKHNMTTIDTLFQHEVATPLGMQNSSFIKTEFIGKHKVSGHRDGKLSNDGWPRSFPEDTPLTFGAAGRLHTNALDYARFMIALIEGEGLTPLLQEEMFKPQAQIPVDSETRQLTGETAWGLGIAIEPTPYGIRYEHGGNNGGFQSGMMLFRDKKLGYVFMTNSDKGEEFNRELERYITEGR